MKRRKGLAQGKPLERRTGLKASTWTRTGKVLDRRGSSRDRHGGIRDDPTYKPPRRGRPLQPQSAKRRAERPARDAVRHATVERAGYRCEAVDLVPEVTCWSPEVDAFGRWMLDTDEVVSRGVRPGGHLDVANTQAVCRAHHDWRGAHPTEARRRGLRKASTDG